MSRRLVFAYPGRLDLNTGGYAYDRRVIAGLEALDWEIELLALGEGFPFPSASVKAAATKALSSLAEGTLVMIDGLALGVLDDWAEKAALRHTIVALVHHPLALEGGLSAEQAATFRQSESRALSFASAVVVTSPMTARELSANYGVAADDITTAVPGTDPAPMRAAKSRTPHILSVGSLIGRKGHDVLIESLDRVRDLAWTAVIIGSRDLDPAVTAALEAQIRQLGLGARLRLAGECSDVRSVMASADIFALASRYEGYGMVFAEALSHGLPIVACHAGAVPDVVPEDAGILVDVDYVEAFADALRLLLTDMAERQRRAEASRKAGAALPGWPVTARIIATRLESLA
ncbi:glycosyltransferase family 4 protein [Rhizobium halophytocola]|uniref:Glycosyltransferase involved in cell wall biosynthesis n=1 Tax=Rhizobium halophytocola TaxID=735519 RepID=A0ABS4DUV8_9HYPH|nr:glycosyltransferase involved in cell wall biosynthesis [Rhizobium halophytocola]